MPFGHFRSGLTLTNQFSKPAQIPRNLHNIGANPILLRDHHAFQTPEAMAVKVVGAVGVENNHDGNFRDLREIRGNAK
jgi:hypothetical protein